jgi:hypothetical protein
MLNALASAQAGLDLLTPSIHRLQLGLPGFLIPFAPLAFASQCQVCPRKPPSPRVFLLISTHFTATLGIPLPSDILQPNSIERPLQVKPGVFTSNLSSHLQALYAQ